MNMTIIEKILASHSDREKVTPGDIVDITIDVCLARDFGGANVVNNLEVNGLSVLNPQSTYFTFDCNPTGSDQKYAANQQRCRQYARDNGIQVFDINAGIGTHLAMDKGLALPGSTVVSTDSHANIMGAIGAFGQGMGDRDIAAAWSKGKVWFRVPPSVKILIVGERPENISAKDIVLNLLKEFGANSLLGMSVELYGNAVNELSLDERITISSMATEMGAIALLIPPTVPILRYLREVSGKELDPIWASEQASYLQQFELNIENFRPLISLPGHPHNVVPIADVEGVKIDSAFVGSCTNGRMEDMRQVAHILQNRKIAPGVVLKIVPSTDQVWHKCLKTGLLEVFKQAGALVGNAGCAGCAAGQIGQNGPGEVTVSTGNRNFAGKQGKGEVYLSSPAIAAASAVAGYITTPERIPENPQYFIASKNATTHKQAVIEENLEKNLMLIGRVWIIEQDNIDTDMIFHNQHLAITEMAEMGRYTFGNLEGWEDFAQKAGCGDIIVTGKNFGAGSSRQQAVDCFKALGVQAILAQSFGAIYERNAINAGFPILTYHDLDELKLKNGDEIEIDLLKGRVTNKNNHISTRVNSFSDVQTEIYQKGDLLRI